VHEVAQVIATAFQNGDLSGEVATVTKLSRVLLIVPIILSLGWQTQRPSQAQQPARPLPIPWFVLFFCVLVGVNSLGLVAAPIKAVVLSGNQVLLCMSLVAMGLETNIAQPDPARPTANLPGRAFVAVFSGDQPIDGSSRPALGQTCLSMPMAIADKL
jgi:uncharacterized membrane protein YadS